MSVEAILTPSHMGRRGEAVADFDGTAVFLPYALPGETIRAGVDGERGTLHEVLTTSPQRVDPFCAHFGLCGGCLLQHWERNAYSAWKRGLVEAALRHAGLDAPLAGLVDAGGDGRRRATIHARRSGAGFMKLRSHSIHDIDRCPILVPALASSFDIARAIQSRVGDCDVTFTASDTGLDAAIKGRRDADQLALASLANELGLARLSLNGEILIEHQTPAVAFGRAKVKLPVQSFLQATAAGENSLASMVKTAVAGTKRVADLFCGIGPFALRLAETSLVFAADSDGAAITALTAAARHVERLKPVEAVKRDLYREPLTSRELAAFDAVIVDPPRAGAEAQMRELAKSTVRTIASVSCDPGTFARDAAILIKGGYRLLSVTPVDQFVWSAHVEIMGVLTR